MHWDSEIFIGPFGLCFSSYRPYLGNTLWVAHLSHVCQRGGLKCLYGSCTSKLFCGQSSLAKQTLIGTMNSSLKLAAFIGNAKKHWHHEFIKKPAGQKSNESCQGSSLDSTMELLRSNPHWAQKNHPACLCIPHCGQKLKKVWLALMFFSIRWQPGTVVSLGRLWSTFWSRGSKIVDEAFLWRVGFASSQTCSNIEAEVPVILAMMLLEIWESFMSVTTVFLMLWDPNRDKSYPSTHVAGLNLRKLQNGV